MNLVGGVFEKGGGIVLSRWQCVGNFIYESMRLTRGINVVVHLDTGR